MNNTNFKAAFFRQLTSCDEITRLFGLLPDVSFFIKDRDGRFVSLNQRGWEYCGVKSEDEAIGKTDHDFFPMQRANEYQADDMAVMASGQPILNRVESAPERAGSPRLVMTTKVPLHDDQGKVIGVAGFSRQIDQTRTPSGEVASFARVVEYLHEHYGQKITTGDLAAMANLSISQFDRQFRRAFGSSPRQYLLRIRVEAACRLLAETDDSISTIAQACGFYDHSHFARCFHRFVDASPTEYRNRGRS